jgi:hypothetical protein
MDFVQKQCTGNCMQINIFKKNLTSFTGKTNSIGFNYFLGDLSIVRNDYVKDPGVKSGSKLHFIITLNILSH